MRVKQLFDLKCLLKLSKIYFEHIFKHIIKMGHKKSCDKLSPKVNALLIIDVQEKIIRAIFNKESITKNIKKLIDAYQILEENLSLIHI